MLKSMTAFGRASLSIPLGYFLVEIQSVNKKYLDINVSLPKELSQFEHEIKKWISTSVNRGLVSVKISARFEKSSPISVKPNTALATQIIDAWKELAEDLALHVNKGDIGIPLLSQYDDILTFNENLKDEDVYRKALHQVVMEALDQFSTMREVEGATLANDITSRFNMLKECISQIEKKSPDSTKKFKQKLTERLEEVLSGSIENEEKILREVVVYAEKVDITEELVRFRSHLQQAEKLMAGDGSGVGRTLDFLLQEFNRETNTIGSKSMDAEISHHVVKMKSELEKIREQIQNIE